jgi:hypothetical protein
MKTREKSKERSLPHFGWFFTRDFACARSPVRSEVHNFDVRLSDDHGVGLFGVVDRSID